MCFICLRLLNLFFPSSKHAMHVAFDSCWRNSGAVCLSEDLSPLFLGRSDLFLEAEEVKGNSKKVDKKRNSLHN